MRAQLLEHIGRAYRRRNDDKTAVSYLQDAVELRSKMSQGADDEERAALMVELAISIRESGDVLGSDSVLREVSDMLQRLKLERSLTYARMLVNRGRVQMRLGKVDAAQAYFDQSLALFQDRLGPRHHEVATLLVEKATAFLWEDDNVAAERHAREAVDIYSAVFPPLHPDRAQAQAQLGEALRLQGRLDEASVMFKEALNAYSIVYGDDDRRVADVLDSLAKIRRAQRDLSDAEKFAAAGRGRRDQGGRSGPRENGLLPHLAGRRTDRAPRIRRGGNSAARRARHLPRDARGRPSLYSLRRALPGRSATADQSAEGRRSHLHARR